MCIPEHCITFNILKFKCFNSASLASSRLHLLTYSKTKLHMKTFYSIIVLVSLMVVNTVAQTTQTVRTSQIEANLGLVKPSMLGSSQRTEDCDTFSNLCPDDSLVVYTTAAGGYVAGQNGYGDISKADVFKLPGTTIKGVMLFFGVGTAVDTVNQFKVRIWDNDGLFADGSTGAPGTVLAEMLNLILLLVWRPTVYSMQVSTSATMPATPSPWLPLWKEPVYPAKVRSLHLKNGLRTTMAVDGIAMKHGDSLV